MGWAVGSLVHFLVLPEILGDEATKGEIVKAMFEITRAVETVKKQVMRLEKRDDTTLL